MSSKDLILNVGADSKEFSKEISKVKKTAEDLVDATVSGNEKMAKSTKLTIKELQERARAERSSNAEAQKLYDSTRTAAEKYNTTLKNLQGHLKAGRIDQETYNRSLKAAKDGFDKAGGSAKASSQVVGHFKGQIAALVSPVGLATAAVGLLVAETMKSVDAFKAAERSIKDIDVTFKNLGLNLEGYDDKFLKNAGRWGVTINDQRIALNTLVKASGDVVQAEQDLERAFKISQYTGRNLQDVTNSLNQARNGSVDSLLEIGALTADEVRALNDVENQSDRTALAIQVLDERTVDLTENQSALDRAMGSINAQAEKNREAFGGLVVSVGKAVYAYTAVGGPLGLAATHIKGLILPTKDLKDATKELADEIIVLGNLGPYNTLGDQRADELRREREKRADEMEQARLKRDEELRKERAKQKAQQDAAARKATETRIELTVFDLELHREQDELEKEKLRLRKEVYQLQQSTTDAGELELKIALATERSELAQAEIVAQRKEDVKEEARIKKENADAEFYEKGPAEEMFAARLKYLEKLETKTDKYKMQLAEIKALREAGLITLDEELELQVKLGEERDKGVKAEKDGYQGLKKIGGDSAKAVGDAFQTLLFDKTEDGFDKMLKNFSAAMAKMILQATVLQAIQQGINGLGGAGATGAAGTTVSILKAIGGFSQGGPVSGPGTGTSDSILARLSDGEYVQRTAAVNYYGKEHMDDLNNLRIPKRHHYSQGGIVSATGGSPSGGVQGSAPPATNVNIVNVTPEAAPDYLASRAGQRDIVNIIKANKSALKNILS